MECNRNNGINNGIVKSKFEHHKDATIFNYVHCVSLSIFNVLTQSFSVLKVSAKNVKRWLIDKQIQLQV